MKINKDSITEITQEDKLILWDALVYLSQYLFIKDSQQLACEKDREWIKNIGKILDESYEAWKEEVNV